MGTLNVVEAVKFMYIAISQTMSQWALQTCNINASWLDQNSIRRWKKKVPQKPQHGRGKHGGNLRRGNLKRDAPPPYRSHTVGGKVNRKLKQRVNKHYIIVWIMCSLMASFLTGRLVELDQDNLKYIYCTSTTLQYQQYTMSKCSQLFSIFWHCLTKWI